MRSWVLLSMAGLALLVCAGSAQAGANAGAHAKIHWGANASATTVDVAIDTTTDTNLNLWVTVVGLNSVRGGECQVLFLTDRALNGVYNLPEAWQMQSGDLCGNDANLSIPQAAATAYSSVPGLAATSGFDLGTTGNFGEFNGLWVLHFAAAGSGAAVKVPGTTYVMMKAVMVIPGNGTCVGAQGDQPICIAPNLRQGYSNQPAVYKQPVAAVLDGTLATDFATFDSGFDRVTANYTGAVGLQGCPAPTRISVTTWGQLRKTYRR